MFDGRPCCLLSAMHICGNKCEGWLFCLFMLKGHTKINAFNWSKVRKLSFKRKRFLIKLRPDVNVSSQNYTVKCRNCQCLAFWVFLMTHRVHIRTLWSFWWPAETVVKSSGRSVSSITPFFASLRNQSPSQNRCSSREALPSDSGRERMLCWESFWFLTVSLAFPE